MTSLFYAVDKRYLKGKLCSSQISIASSFSLNSTSLSLSQLPREDGSLIHYYLQAPLLEVESSKELVTTLLVLIQGSSCVPISAQSEIMRKMAQVMPKAEVLWVEKRGLEEANTDSLGDLESCSERYYQHESLYQRVEDYKAVITSLADQYSQIVLLGASEGTTIVGLLRQDGLAIDASIALNGGGQYFMEDILWNMEQTLVEPGRTDALEGIKNFAEHVLVMTEADLRQDQDFSSNHSLRWWQEMLLLDMLDVWQKGKSPLLMIQALGDNNVSVMSAEAMFLSLAVPEITVRTFPDLDHGFKDEMGQSHGEDIVKVIEEWIPLILE